MTDWMAVNGVWERTNDFTEAADNYPNSILYGAYNGNYVESGRVYNHRIPFLYSQGYFDQPPYDYHDIFKVGLHLKPTTKWEIYLDYTRNPNRFAGNIDDNSNHVGVEMSYRIRDGGFVTHRIGTVIFGQNMNH